MTRKRQSRNGARDGHRFLALPHVVLDSPAYRALSHTARSLLIDIARQHTSMNNGKLTASAKYLRLLGWTSNDTINRAKAELLKCGLLIETRKGARPNKAAWYMLAGCDLDIADGMDSEPATYRGMRRGYQRAGDGPLQGDNLAPSRGVAASGIAPSAGIRR